MSRKVPGRLVSNCEESPERMVWLEQLPTAVHELERLWSLTLGTPFDGPRRYAVALISYTSSVG